jgi:P2 family phage contractile tail tube protein
MNLVQTMESANLFCGRDFDGENSNHLVLTQLQLPSLEKQYVDHRAGGAPLAMEVDTVTAKPQCTFTILGWTPQIMQLYNSWSGDDNWFTAYGLVRDQMSGTAMQAVAMMCGQLGRVNPVSWQKGDLSHYQYSIRGMTYYQLVLADEPLVLWDFFNNTFIIGDRQAA